MDRGFLLIYCLFILKYYEHCDKILSLPIKTSGRKN